MRLRWLRSCCCCCELRDGVLGIGLLHCLLDVLASLWLAILVADGALVRRVLSSQPDLVDPDEYEDAGPPPHLATLTGAVRTAAAALLAVLLLSLPPAAALLVGAAARRRRLLLPWLGWHGLLLLAQLVLAATALTAAAASWQQTGEAWYAVLLQTLCAAVSVYFYLVVLSFFAQLKDRERKDFATTPIMT